MARLDIEEAEACEASTMIDAKTALDYLADLPDLWRKTAPERRRNLAEAIFERIEVLGVKAAIITPTREAEAHGWREAGATPSCLYTEMGMVGARGLEAEVTSEPGPDWRFA
jgi:hypothetical protein